LAFRGFFFTGLTVADLVAGACVTFVVLAAIAGAARTETATRAAEMVFNIRKLLSKGIPEGAGRMTGLFDRGATLRAAH
jgi:hypothetical protein